MRLLKKGKDIYSAERSSGRDTLYRVQREVFKAEAEKSS